MAAYPTLDTLRSSAYTRDGGFDSARATNGALKVRRLFSAEKTEFTLDHSLTSTTKSTLETFYQTNKDLDVTFTWQADGASYTVRFLAPPQYLRLPGGWQARVRLSEV